MINRMVTSALVAGFAAGLFAALMHFAFVQQKILLAEDYESGEAIHFAGVNPALDARAVPATIGAEEAGNTPDMGHQDLSTKSGSMMRNAQTVLFHILLYCSYALVLVAGFALADRWGKRVTARDGLLWGIAGFVAVQLAPAMGLEPELPGTMAAPLLDRQVWWAGTALCSAAALAMMGYGRNLTWVAIAALLLALPHIIGAPELDTFSGVAPPELAASFAARSLGLGLATWAIMGWLAGWLWQDKQG